MSCWIVFVQDTEQTIMSMILSSIRQTGSEAYRNRMLYLTENSTRYQPGITIAQLYRRYGHSEIVWTVQTVLYRELVWTVQTVRS